MGPAEYAHTNGVSYDVARNAIAASAKAAVRAEARRALGDAVPVEFSELSTRAKNVLTDMGLHTRREVMAAAATHGNVYFYRQPKSGARTTKEIMAWVAEA